MRLEDRLEMFMYSRKIRTIDVNIERIFVINYGPPASGKSSIKTNKYILKLLDKRFTDINVDTIVADLFLKSGVSSELTQEVYFKLRKDADEESDNMLVNSIIDRHNIVWETTGRDKSWIKYVIDFIKQYGYRILLVIPMVYLLEEQKRCKLRKQAANCSLEYLSDIRTKSYNNFESIAHESDQTIVFDNNRKLFLLYDSLGKKCGDLHDIIIDPDQTGLHDFVIKECRKRSKRRSKSLSRY